MSWTYTRMIVARGMSCFIYVKLTPQKWGMQYFGTNDIIRSEGKEI